MVRPLRRKVHLDAASALVSVGNAPLHLLRVRAVNFWVWVSMTRRAPVCLGSYQYSIFFYKKNINATRHVEHLTTARCAPSCNPESLTG